MTKHIAPMWSLAAGLSATHRLRCLGGHIAFSFSGLVSAAVLFAIVAASARANPIYVDDDAPLDGDGTSWATAFPDLQDDRR